MNAELIAEIKFPIAVTTLAAIVDALERLHGKGLTARTVTKWFESAKKPARRLGMGVA